MITSFFVYILLSINAFSLASCTGRKYADVFPITNLFYAILIYISGLLHILNLVVYIFFVLTGISLIISIWKSREASARKEIIKNYFSEEFVLFTIFYAAIIVLKNGILVSKWDEFSHWAYAAKSMTLLDDFTLSALSDDFFASYPPIMACWQYLFEKVTILFGNAFDEALLYNAYILLCSSLLLPLISRFSKRNKGLYFVSAALFVLSPGIIFYDWLNTLYIDPFLGIASACTLLYVLIYNKTPILQGVIVSFAVFCIVLAKDAGILFAAVAVVYVLINNHMKYKSGRKLTSALIFSSVFPVISLAFAKLSWSYEIKAYGAARSFSEKIDFIECLKAIFLRGYDPVRFNIFINYFRTIISKPVNMGMICLPNLLVLLIILFAGMVLLYHLAKNVFHTQDGHLIKSIKTLIITDAFLTVLFVIGMCPVYMYKFDAGEALTIPSYNRYISILTVVLTVHTVFLLLYIAASGKLKRKAVIASVLLASALLPYKNYFNLILRNDIKTALSIRSHYDRLSDAVLQTIPPDNNTIQLIDQKDDGSSFWAFHYLLSPNKVRDDWWLSNEGAADSVSISADEWLRSLQKKYDYVLICRADDEFKSHYSALFEDANEIDDESLYKVGKEKLIKVELPQ